MSKKKCDDNRQNLVAYYQSLLDRETIVTPYNLTDCHNNTKRKSNRFRTNGIVALTSSEKPIVTNIYDIGPDGLSFLHANETDVTDSEFRMDILIFDSRRDFEYLISQVEGCVKSKKLIPAPNSNAAIWKFSVEFLDLDHLNQSILQIFFNLVQIPNIQDPVEHRPNIPYDS